MRAAIAVAGLVAAGTAVVMAGEETSAAKASVADLAWLAGEWTSDEHGMAFDEHWLAPRGDSMFAVSRMVANGTTKMCELSAIEQTADGLVFRIRHFSKALEPWRMDADGPMTMKLAASKENEVVFEDPARDFPRRVVYRREKDVLVARLEGEDRGKPKAQEFRLTLAARR